ncbi:MAG: AAA family ATPase [Oscillatoria sp. PMC 1051.18]|nr:AAA family ATPase [Oscillatoria sp. PMC 1050.18]MEC5029243.1 AAA family ATPase [Oscillatoria sp. PMC 1051.18]
MKIEICNLGVIEKAEIDLKPLTVFIGHNGTGKTWTAYTLASIFSSYGYEYYLRAYIDNQTQQLYPPIDTAIDKIINEGNAQIDLIDLVDKYAETYLNELAKLTPSWMRKFLATERVDFQNLQISFDLKDTKKKLIKKIYELNIEVNLSPGFTKDFSLLNGLKESNNSTLYFYTISTNSQELLQKLPEKAIKHFIFSFIFKVIHSFIFKQIYTFPTERTTFITLPFQDFNPATAQAAIKEQQIQNTKPRFYEPVKDFLKIISQIIDKNKLEREELTNQHQIISKFVQLSALLEDNILAGKVNFYISDLQKELLFEASDNCKLEMPIVSSMVKELAPLVLYLRELAEPNELIIIDEPEMNLHPAAQVEIIEFLAMLVEAGLNVLITTHSPYIVDHLSNLIKAATYEDKESIKERFYLERTEAFIPQDKVSVYLFEDGTAKNILGEEGRIDWGTFADVSDDISHIFS